MTAQEVDRLTESQWTQLLIQRDGELLRVPLSVSVEVGAFRFTSSQGLPKGMVREVLSTRKRRRGKFSQPKCAQFASLGCFGGRDRALAAQRDAYYRAMATGSWA